MAENNGNSNNQQNSQKRSSIGNLARMLNWLDAPADLGVIGLMAYVLTQGRLRPGDPGSQPISDKGIFDEAALMWLLNTLKKIGGKYGQDVAKSIEAIHFALVKMDKKMAADFRCLLFAGIKKDDVASFCQKLVDDIPAHAKTGPDGSAKNNQLGKYLKNHTDPRIMMVVEFHEELERLRYEHNPPNVLSQEQVAEIFIKEALEKGLLEESLTHQGKEQLKKAVHDLNDWIDAWTRSLEKRRDNPIKYGGLLLVVVLLVISFAMVLQSLQTEKYQRWDDKPRGTIEKVWR